MKKVRVLCVGKTKESYLNTGLELLTRKIGRYCDFSTVIIKEAKYSSGNRQQWLKSEADGISKHLNGSHYTIICDEKGKQMASVVLAESFMKWANQGFSHFDFVIGGAYGISDTLKKQANLVLSFSQMTMTHQMFRLFLYEQLYRSYTIINGEKYHHN
jgi:23S rRNA (pseudouridine1915-N3)-methyltransferase